MAKAIVASVFNATRGTDMRFQVFSLNRFLFKILSVFGLVFLSTAFGWAGQGGWRVLSDLPTQDSDIKVKRPVFAAVDPQRHRYYITDADQALLIAFDENGAVLGTLNPENAFQRPVSMAFGKPGRLWVSDRARNELLYLDLEKKSVRAFSVTYADKSPIVPGRIAVLPDRGLFVLDRMRGQVVQLDDNMQVVCSFQGESSEHGIIDFVVKENDLWALQLGQPKLLQFDLSGKLKQTLLLNGELDFPYAMDMDGGGLFYILDRHAGNIAVFNQRGQLSFKFMTPGRRPGQLHYPADLCFDWSGRLFVVNEGNGRVEVLGR